MSAESREPPGPTLPGRPPTVAPVRAVVDAGSVSTTYIRAGAGTPVVILRPGAPARAVGRGLLPHLAPHFRVIEPESCSPSGRAVDAGDGVAFSSWLREFLDGLGLARVSLVVQETVAVRALSFAIAHPGRVGGLVLVHDDADDPRSPTLMHPDHLGRSGHPVLTLRMPDTAGELPGDVVATVVAFLKESAGGATGRTAAPGARD